MTEAFFDYAPTVGTVFFFTAFCYIVYVALKKSNKKKFDNFSKIPLQDKD